jgi:uncharacterized membrane-anchored protein
MRILTIVFTLFFMLSGQLTAGEEGELTPEQKAYIEQAKKLLDSLHPQHGEIKLSKGSATLNVPDSFYYLDPKDTETVLVDIWGNPPSGVKTLGMLFPAGMTPFDQDAWGVTIDYQADGYVSDEDADEINYDDLLSQMKEDVAAENKEREKQGYESISLVGWAANPYYDKSTHKLHWAKEFKFGSDELHTLNYNIRVLGRKGVLVLNFIAGMDQLGMINSKVDTVLNMAEFDQGAQYSDFNPEIDEVAAYGLGALIAGKVAAKTGLIAMALVFLKKFWIFLIIGVGAFFKKLFGRKDKGEIIPEESENK